jgi:dTDP-4-dehydrorhamnose reductase
MNKRRLLITGGAGLLALNWFAAVRDRYDVILAIHNRHPQVSGATVVKIDLESMESVTGALRAHAPELVVHSAGYTSVEGCEADPRQARRVNAVLAANVAKACHFAETPLVHISTDHLFDGTTPMVAEDALVEPINEYARTKAEAELLVAEACPEALLIRTNFYGWGTSYRKSFSDFIIDALRQKRSITLFEDVYYTPIVVERMANVVHDLVTRKACGVFNVVGNQRITKYQFGLLVAKIFDLDPSFIKPGRLLNMPALVSRPRDMSLSSKKVRAFLDVDMGTVDDHLQMLRKQEQVGLAFELKKL